MQRFAACVVLAVLSVPALLVPEAAGIILLATDDPNVNITSPGDNSGWQFEGQFNSFLGTPIAPSYFLTAHHLNQAVGAPFYFHGQTYTTTEAHADPAGTDLMIWKVDGTFSTWAPLYTGSGGGGGEIGQELRVHGRGTRRGTGLAPNGTLIGWNTGIGDHVQRWGSNLITGITEPDGIYVYANFDSPGIANEAHFSSGDSGGGSFILENGLWKLAGINYGVDDVYTSQTGGTHIVAPIFDARGYYSQDEAGNYHLIAGPDPVPTAFYCTRVSPRLDWIESVIGGTDASVLPAESFDNWLHGYFDVGKFSDPATVGPNADPDGDGITNLAEFAFNLDPSVAEPLIMTAGTGVRGLPLIRLETIAATNDTRLTVEYLRRTAAGGGGLTYTVQFANDLSPDAAGTSDGWQTAGGSETVSAINTRWDRVKIIDAAPAGGSTRRFARVLVAADGTPAPDSAAPQTSSSIRLGSSMQSLMRTSAVTASLPSTTR